MTRQRSQTIGSLGRSPARSSNGPENVPTPGSSNGGDEPPPVGSYLRRWIHGALFENTGLKFLSLVLAVTVFLLVNADKDRSISTRINVKYEYPADKVLVSEQLEQVKVELKGPMRRLRQTSELALMELDLRLRDGQTGDIAITEDMIRNIPPGVEVVSISPRAIRVVFDKRAEKVLEVTPAVAGRPQHGYVVAEVKSTPPTIKVRGAERLLAAMSSIRTSEVSLEGRTEPFEQLAEVAAPDGVNIDPTQRITVQVRIVEELVTKKVPSLVVSVKGEGVDPAKWQVTPAQVEITLTGALLLVDKAREQMRPVVKVSAADTKAKDADVVLDGLPPGVGVRISPERVRVTPVKPAP
jgi:YbbR domain-containing protein